jgi:hypothetical protein
VLSFYTLAPLEIRLFTSALFDAWRPNSISPLKETPMNTKHPGTVIFIDETTEKVRPAETVPDSLRFARNALGHWVPVVKVVASMQGDKRMIRSYGADGAELSATILRRN